MINSFEKCISCLASFETKYCKDCHKYVCDICVKTNKTIMFVLKKHYYCVECEDEICCFKKICGRCDRNPFHMITDRIAVGSCDSQYNFDIIVNLNYPENNVKEDEIKIIKKQNQMIILVGITDTESKEKEVYILLKNIIPVLYENYNNSKILFHCFAGMSRSAMFAIGYLSYSMNITIEDAIELVKEKRKFIEVNKGFLKALKRFEKE